MQPIQLISLRHSAFYTPFLMTFVGDFLMQQGLVANYRCAGSIDELEAAILDGSADVAQSAVGVTIRQLDKNSAEDKGIRHFAQINQRDGFFIAAAIEDNQTVKKVELEKFDWKALENKKIIADHLFQPMATLKYVLVKHGVDIRKVEFIDVGSIEQSQIAFLSGQADYIHLQGPYPQQLSANGKAVIVASVGEALGDIAYSSLCASSTWLQSAKAQSFMLAYKAALEYVQVTNAEYLATQLSSQFESISQQTLCDTIKDYQALACWSSDACISKASFESANNVFLFSDDISKSIPYQNVVSTLLC